MPSLGSHLARAIVVADRLALPVIDADRGAYYLGATAPDIRVMLQVDRRETHFYDLDDFAEQDSIARMFEAHPGLADGGLEDATRAFMAGYLTHLVLDETYIAEVYRPCFGAYSTIDDDPRSDILDRALQYEVDVRDRSDRPRMRSVRAALAAAGRIGGIPFIEDARLEEWATRVDDIATRPADYSRFAQTLTRHLGRDAMGGGDSIREACANPSVLVAEAYTVVGEERVARFIEHADERAAERVRGFLQ